MLLGAWHPCDQRGGSGFPEVTPGVGSASLRCQGLLERLVRPSGEQRPSYRYCPDALLIWGVEVGETLAGHVTRLPCHVAATQEHRPGGQRRCQAGRASACGACPRTSGSHFHPLGAPPPHQPAGIPGILLSPPSSSLTPLLVLPGSQGTGASPNCFQM